MKKTILLISVLVVLPITLLAQKIKELPKKSTAAYTANPIPKPASNNPKPIVVTKNKDSDGDGIIDTQDPCPFKRGPLSNNGCPVVTAPKESGTELYKKGVEAFNNNQISESIEFLQRATELKNGSAACLLGKIYFEGESIPSDLYMAFAYFDTAAMYGNDVAMYNLALMYKNGYGTNTDNNKAMEFFYKAADKNNDESMVALGEIFLLGEMVQQSNEKAVEWYQKAAALENADAYVSLGKFYSDGKAISKNIDKSIEWFKKAAETGNEYAMRMLAINYEQKKFLGDAFMWYKKAAEKEEIFSMLKIVHAYRQGAGNIAKDRNLYEEWLSKAIEVTDREMDNLDAETLFETAKMLSNADQPDNKKVFELYKKAADAGKKEAPFIAATMAMEGWGDKYADAIYYYSKAVELNDDTEAMNKLGFIYSGGVDASKYNYTEAARWFALAAARGHAESINSLGEFYLVGRGVELSYKKAFDLFTQAVGKNLVSAQNNLGLSYYYAWGTEKNLVKALELFQMAANAGHTDALISAAHMHSAGEGTEKNFQKAYEYLQKASQLGVGKAMVLIGEFYEYGRGFAKSIENAKEWYQKGADLGDDLGMLNLGLLLLEGKGGEKNIVKANEWITKAANKGNMKAKHYVALRLLKEKDYPGAFKNFKTAANNGINESAFYLASFYDEGIATSQNYTEAIKWYEVAADINNSDAMNNLGLMYEKGKGVSSPDYSAAAKWYTRAAELGNPSAMNNIGSLYTNGKGVQQNKKTALDWFKKACDAGSQTGCDNVKKFK